MMTEFLPAANYPELLGKRAEIKQIKTYCSYLHGAIGTITEVHDRLFLKFDKPAEREPGSTWRMDGVYLTADSYEILNEENTDEEDFVYNWTC